MSMSRQEESFRLLRDMMNMALGVYSAKEVAEADNWREKSIWQATQHLEHEVGEIKRSKELSRKLHNALDSIGQSAITAATILLEMDRRGEKPVTVEEMKQE